MAKWQVDGGNSTNGAVGFVLHGIEAESEAAALEIAKASLPEAINTGSWGIEDGQLMVYINTEALTVADVSEDAWDDEDEDEGEPK